MKSMTGFGSTQYPGKRGRIRVEARSYNHRYLELRVRVSRHLQAFESRVYLWGRNRLERGRVEIGVALDEFELEMPLQFKPFALRFYLELEEKLQQEYGLTGKLDIPSVLQLREVIGAREEEPAVEELWPEVLVALEEAVLQMEEMQEREGRALQTDLIQRLRFLFEQLRAIESLAKDLPAQFRARLEERIARLLPLEHCDPQRIAQEVVLYSDKVDITEEIVRLSSHLEICLKAAGDGSLKGKRLDFFAQEIHREINTIGAKSPQTEIIHRIVDMKTELEKIREQAQNVL